MAGKYKIILKYLAVILLMTAIPIVTAGVFSRYRESQLAVQEVSPVMVKGPLDIWPKAGDYNPSETDIDAWCMAGRNQIYHRICLYHLFPGCGVTDDGKPCESGSLLMIYRKDGAFQQIFLPEMTDPDAIIFDDYDGDGNLDFAIGRRDGDQSVAESIIYWEERVEKFREDPVPIDSVKTWEDNPEGGFSNAAVCAQSWDRTRVNTFERGTVTITPMPDGSAKVDFCVHHYNRVLSLSCAVRLDRDELQVAIPDGKDHKISLELYFKDGDLLVSKTDAEKNDTVYLPLTDENGESAYYPAETITGPYTRGKPYFLNGDIIDRRCTAEQQALIKQLLGDIYGDVFVHPMEWGLITERKGSLGRIGGIWLEADTTNADNENRGFRLLFGDDGFLYFIGETTGLLSNNSQWLEAVGFSECFREWDRVLGDNPIDSDLKKKLVEREGQERQIMFYQFSYLWQEELYRAADFAWRKADEAGKERIINSLKEVERAASHLRKSLTARNFSEEERKFWFEWEEEPLEEFSEK